MTEAHCSSRSTGKNKNKCEFENPDSTKKIHADDVLQFIGTTDISRNPRWDCRCDGGKGYITVNEPRWYVGISRFEILSECGNFSVDGQRSFLNDRSELKYLHLPKNILKLRFDLNIGLDDVVKKDWSADEKLDFILKWILSNRQKFLASHRASCSTSLERVPVDFCCYRGLLTAIFTTPYEKMEEWIICATKFKGTIYLCARPTDRKLMRLASMTEKESTMCSWGYKFEQYMTKSHPRGFPDPPHTPVNENAEYCAVFKSRLNNNVLLYAAEVDGVNVSSRSRRYGNGASYIELKTSKMISTEIQDINFCRYKVLKWWAQCCLAATTKLFCGFRDEVGVIQYMRQFNLLDMPCFGEGLWLPCVCFNFANCFLSFVKKVVVKDDPAVVYKFEWVPGSDVTYQEFHTSTTPELQILPEWYTSQFEP